MANNNDNCATIEILAARQRFRAVELEPAQLEARLTDLSRLHATEPEFVAELACFAL